MKFFPAEADANRLSPEELLKATFRKRLGRYAKVPKISTLDILLGTFQKLLEHYILRIFDFSQCHHLQPGNVVAFSQAAILILLELLGIKFFKIIKQERKRKVWA